MRKKLILVLSALFTSILAQAQITVTGVISASDGGTIPFATVLEKGTSNTASSDINGAYEIKVADANSVLIFSFVGYKDLEITVADQTVVSPTLISNTDLDDAVVMGYGNQKRSKISGSVSTISAKEITELPILRTEQALQGRSAGVQVSQNSGQPGSAQSIRIRGTGSINNAEPLFVVDGIPSFGIDYLNPSDIASITVLKDAASAAIYGARGGNGVVLVTTKKGNYNQPAQISYESYVGLQEPWKKVGLLNAEQYAIIMNESRAAAGLPALTALSNPASLASRSTDWQDAVFQRAPMTNHSFSFTKGGANSSTAIGASYLLQDGIVGGDKGRFERYTFRVNNTQSGGDRFRIGQNFNFTHLQRSALAENNEFATPVLRALNIDPITQVTRPDGEYAYSSFIDSDIANPVNQIATTFDNWTTNRLVASAYGEYDITPNLTFRSTYSLDLSLGSQKIFNPTFDLAIGENDPERPAYEWREINSVTRVENKWTNWQWENVATYTKDFENEDKLVVIAGYSALYNRFTNLGATRDSLATNNAEQAFLANSLNSAEQAPSGFDSFGESSFISTFFRANYDLGNQFSFAATVRRDGSSRFGANNRYGIFPSFSAAWNLTEKDFVKNNEKIDFLKLRASWGRNGNADGIGNYDYTSLVINGLNYTFSPDQQQVNGAGPVVTSNPDLKWETVEQFNIGIDADFYKGKLNTVVDYFIKNTNDMLAAVPLPGIVGLNPAATNVASAKNSGVELMVNYRNLDRDDFTYSVGGNISFIKNEVTDLGEGGQPISTGNVFGNGDFVSYTEIGQPMAYFYGYETAGIFQTNEEAAAASAQPDAVAGDVIFVDQNEDGVIDAEDKTMIGNPHPDFTYGVNADFNWKNFDFSIFIQGSKGNDLYNGIFRYDLNTTNYPISILERWTGEGTSNSVPRVSHSDPNRNYRVSDRFVEDGSYLRLKNIQIGYTLPKTVTDRVQLRKVRVYLAAQNLFTFTDYTGLDPEIGSRGTLEIGIDRGFYPAARMFLAGVNVNF